MKLAVVGKGGAGKTVLAALLSRALAGRGWRVLALDLDTNPGLAVSLGTPAQDAGLPDEAVEERSGPGSLYGWGLARSITPAEVVRRHGTHANEGIVFLGLGNIAEVEKSVKRNVAAVRQVAAGFEEPGWAVVADLEAGPTMPFEGYPRFASQVLVAVEATPASMLTARRLLGILAHDGLPARLVVTKTRGPQDARQVAEEVGPVTGAIPYDPEVRRREMTGSLRDLDAGSPALAAVEDMVERLDARREQEVGTG